MHAYNPWYFVCSIAIQWRSVVITQGGDVQVVQISDYQGEAQEF